MKTNPEITDFFQKENITPQTKKAFKVFEEAIKDLKTIILSPLF